METKVIGKEKRGCWYGTPSKKVPGQAKTQPWII
jgi:hypothetical protein